MRLTCPSCASEYDVDATAIGDRGRMVRCANCGAEWFQAPAGDVAAPPPAPPVSPEPEPAPEPETFAPTEPEVVVYEAPEFNPPPPTYPDPEPVVQERQDFYKVEASPPSRMSADNVERIYYDVEPTISPRFDEVDAVEETRVRRRKDADREDLAASLRELEEDRPSSSGGAFLAGFSTIAVLAVIMIAVYVKAPDLAQLAPAMEGPLAGYTEIVNHGRVALAEATQ